MTSSSFVLYRYDPSLAAAIIFAICFGFSTAFHIFQAAKQRTCYFIPLLIGGFFEIGGYIGRALAHSNESSIPIFILQTLLILVAPALLAASIYMVLGRLIIFTNGEAFAPIRARWLTKTFVCGDVLSFLVQAGGGGLMANSKSANMGKNLAVMGLLLQILFFGIFIITGGLFHFRIVRSPTAASVDPTWKRYMHTLYAASVLILVRSVFRVVEFVGGNDGVLLSHEIYLYLFDAVLILGVMAVFNVVHPGAIIGRKAQGELIRLDGRDLSSEPLTYERK